MDITKKTKKKKKSAFKCRLLGRFFKKAKQLATRIWMIKERLTIKHQEVWRGGPPGSTAVRKREPGSRLYLSKMVSEHGVVHNMCVMTKPVYQEATRFRACAVSLSFTNQMWVANSLAFLINLLSSLHLADFLFLLMYTEFASAHWRACPGQVIYWFFMDHNLFWTSFFLMDFLWTLLIIIYYILGFIHGVRLLPGRTYTPLFLSPKPWTLMGSWPSTALWL